ncbi:unnamed protein product, partial [Choristocarpus tenellus]
RNVPRSKINTSSIYTPSSIWRHILYQEGWGVLTGATSPRKMPSKKKTKLFDNREDPEQEQSHQSSVGDIVGIESGEEEGKQGVEGGSHG